MGCRIVYEGGQGEIVEKKSRFIATVRPVKTEQEANSFVSEMKKQYWDARHNCSAFVLGSNREITRCSDDGEPAQTAGRPMLEVLLGQEITDAAVVVTRYFGGILLGTGGLVRAYQKAVQAGLSACRLMERKQGYLLTVCTDYEEVGRLQYFFAQQHISVLDACYEARVKQQLLVPREQREQLEKAIAEQTAGRAELTWEREVTYGVAEKETILL